MRARPHPFPRKPRCPSGLLTAGAFVIASEPRQPAAVGTTLPRRSAERRPERADLQTMRRWRPPAERREYSAGRLWIVLPALLARLCGAAGVGPGPGARPDLRFG